MKIYWYGIFAGLALAPIVYFAVKNKGVTFVTPEQYTAQAVAPYQEQLYVYQEHLDKLNAQLAGMDSESVLLSSVLQHYSFQDIIELARMGLNECPYTHSSSCEPSETIAVMYTAINQFKRGIWGNDSLSSIIQKRLKNGTYLYSYWRTKTAAQMREEERSHLEAYITMAIEVMADAPDVAIYNFGQTHHCNPKASKCSWHIKEINSGVLEYLGNLSHAKIGSPFVKVLPIGKDVSEVSKHFFAKQS